jgi:hypothetical protein
MPHDPLRVPMILALFGRCLMMGSFKTIVPRDFRLQVFYMDQFPQAPDYIPFFRAVSNFFEISRTQLKVHHRFTTGVNDTGGKWEKSSIRKVFIISFGHL